MSVRERERVPQPPARRLSETERRVLAAIFSEETAHPGALPELRLVAAEALGGDRARAERTLRKLRAKSLLQHCTEGFGFGELSRAGRSEARRLSSQAKAAEGTPPTEVP